MQAVYTLRVDDRGLSTIGSSAPIFQMIWADFWWNIFPIMRKRPISVVRTHNIRKNIMPLKPYPSISRIAALSAQEGHVVALEDGKTIIETGTNIITFHKGGKVTDDQDREISTDDAIKKLKIKLT